MVFRARPSFVVEVVQQRDNAPAVLVLAEPAGIAAHRGFDRQRVLPQTVALRVLGQQRPRVVAIHRIPFERLLDHAFDRRRHAVPGHLRRGHPFGRFGIRGAGHDAAPDEATVIDDHIVILDASVVRTLDPIQDLDDGPRLDLEAGLFADFARHGLAERFADLDHAARQAPLALQRRLSALDEEHPIAVDDDRANADDRPLRKRSHSPMTLTTTRFLRRPSNSA